MKRLLAICTLLAVACLPAAVLGETWWSFLKRVDKVIGNLEDAEGEVAVSVSEVVSTAYNGLLTVPAGVRLVLEGDEASFGNMLLGNGDVTLRGKGMTVREIKFAVDPAAKVPYQAKLTIEEGVTVESIVCAGTFQATTEIDITNHGDIKPRTNERPVHLRVTQAKGDVLLTFRNYGSIESGGEDCGMEIWGQSSGKQSIVTMYNEGVIKH